MYVIVRTDRPELFSPSMEAAGQYWNRERGGWARGTSNFSKYNSPEKAEKEALLIAAQQPELIGYLTVEVW